MTALEQLLHDRAVAMAAHDGAPVGVVHLHGAANQLQAEIVSARDRLIAGPGAAAEPVAEAAKPETKAEAPKPKPVAAKPAPEKSSPEPAAAKPAAETEAKPAADATGGKAS